MFATLLAALTLTVSDAGWQPVPVSLPAKDKAPIFRQEVPRTGEATPAPRQRFFGIGVSFQSRGGTQGIALDRVIPDSPADRAGFTVGMVIVEIAGQSTLGRSGEDCTGMVKGGGDAIVLKYYDPLTFKLRVRTVQKDWFFVPN